MMRASMVLRRGGRLQIFSTKIRAFSSSEQQPVAVVQGASRGLGLEFVRQLLNRPTTTVIATCRNPSAASDLHALKSQNPNRLSIIQLDTTDEASIARAASETAQTTPHVNLLLNVSGILHIPGELSPETALSRVTLENLERVFRINTFGPILVSKAFSPLLIAAATSCTDENPSVIANLSARVGSIGDNRLGGWYSYRASKTALNQLTKTMSLELARKNQRVAAILLHPGTCDTGLSQPFQRNVAAEKLFTRERGVEQLLKIVDGVTMRETGKYYAWDGSEIPW